MTSDLECRLSDCGIEFAFWLWFQRHEAGSALHRAQSDQGQIAGSHRWWCQWSSREPMPVSPFWWRRYHLRAARVGASVTRGEQSRSFNGVLPGRDRRVTNPTICEMHRAPHGTYPPTHLDENGIAVALSPAGRYGYYAQSLENWDDSGRIIRFKDVANTFPVFAFACSLATYRALVASALSGSSRNTSRSSKTPSCHPLIRH